MLARADGQMIPIAPIPNGSGDNFCSALGILSFDDALDNIIAATSIKIDTTRILIDREDESDLPQGPDRLKSIRYMISNSAVGMPAVIANAALPYKKCCGKVSYSFACLVECAKNNFKPDLFELTIDGQQVGSEPVETSILMVG